MTKFVWACSLLLTIIATDARAADRWQFGSSPSFSSGKYGTDATTNVLHTPFTARRMFRDGDLALVFPLTCISGGTAVTIVDGSPLRRSNESARTSRAAVSASATNRSDCGLGDILVRGRYYVMDERGWRPTVAVRAHVKAPTASADRGLGTGRFDEGVGLEVSRNLGGGLLAMADGGFTAIGEPAGVDYNNNWWYDAGFGRDFADGTVNLSAFFEVDRAIVHGLPAARDVLLAATVAVAGGWRLQTSALAGLSDGAPDHGFALGLSRRF